MRPGHDDRFVDVELMRLGDQPEALPELETWGLDDFTDLNLSVNYEEGL